MTSSIYCELIDASVVVHYLSPPSYCKPLHLLLPMSPSHLLLPMLGGVDTFWVDFFCCIITITANFNFCPHEWGQAQHSMRWRVRSCSMVDAMMDKETRNGQHDDSKIEVHLMTFARVWQNRQKRWANMAKDNKAGVTTKNMYEITRDRRHQ